MLWKIAVMCECFVVNTLKTALKYFQRLDKQKPSFIAIDSMAKATGKVQHSLQPQRIRTSHLFRGI